MFIDSPALTSNPHMILVLGGIMGNQIIGGGVTG